MSKEIPELTVKKLFKHDDKYIIPLYQRNYAWGEPEIEQLIQDIWDSCRSVKKKRYYIGSLVVSKRKNGCFEVIDGQQRHTTLSILLAVLKNEFNTGGVEETNLSFESREISSKTLQMMFENGKSSSGEASMMNAYEICIKKLSGSGKEGSKDQEKIDVKSFAEYLMSEVIILRTEVPEGTDLNHYFEIMNNRGEQLEKHEVLKARFMNTLENSQERTVFAMIWDACADMNRYVQMGFSGLNGKPKEQVDGKEETKVIPSIRKYLFGSSWEQCPSMGFKGLVEDLMNEKVAIQPSEGVFTGEPSMGNLLCGVFVDEKKVKNQHQTERFSSIIDFPNFLLHVLRLTKSDNEKKNVVLDDKQLLNMFDDKVLLPDANDFIIALLKYRFLFDQYIIKREHDESKDGKWSLKKLNSQSYVNTFDAETRKSILMIQSMFHVSYPTRNYKYWLNDALAYLGCENTDASNGTSFLGHLEKLSDRIFFERFARKESKEYDEILASEGFSKIDAPTSYKTYIDGIHNFVFNRLDYLLWKDRSSQRFIGDTKADAFTFTFKSSVEHVSPQRLDTSNMEENTLKYVMHSFGNLALVSPSFNSSASNKSYKEKLEAFNAKESYESLKLALIYSHDKWDDGLCKKHEEAMLKVLF